MNLQTEIKIELWNAIAKSYDSGNFSNAILDAMHYLSNILRERANIDGDGASLAGQALGGDNPRLRINKYQTESEKNEQKGLEQIIRGMYQGIRNPRSHEQSKDDQEAANAIILFVDYLLGVISQAKAPFVLEEWIKRVFDPDFVESDRYAKLLIGEIPPKRYIDAIITIYREKMSGDAPKLRFTFQNLIKNLDNNQLEEILLIVSDELKTTQDDKVIKMVLQILPEHLWSRITEVARIRIENKLIQSIRLGKTSQPISRKSNPGWLATWGRSFTPQFTLKEDLCYAIVEKLNKGDTEDHNYIAEYFLWYLPKLLVEQPEYWRNSQSNRYCKAIVKGISDPFGSELLRERLLDYLSGFPSEWKKSIIDGIEPLKDVEPEYYKKVLKAQEPEEFDF